MNALIIFLAAILCLIVGISIARIESDARKRREMSARYHPTIIECAQSMDRINGGNQ